MKPGIKWTLVLIALFFLATAGSFIWYVVTWDPSAEPSLSGVSKSDIFTSIA